jgi:glycosyltransferase involved in cell wall biosynthesis
MNIKVLISTMNREDSTSLPIEMRLKNNYVIINQITKGITMPKDIKSSTKTFLSFKERGLSRSRNRAIQNTDADICVIADDDMYYEKDYEKTINDAYAEFPDADIIAFYVENEGTDHNKKPLKKGRLNLIQTMKIASCQMTFRRKSLVDNGIAFDNDFGTGSDISMGEENILLFDCVKKGLGVYSYPVKIATLRQDSVSTWFKGYTEKYFIDRGKVFYRMSAFLYILLIVQFAIRKFYLYKKNNISILCALTYMIIGANDHSRRA